MKVFTTRHLRQLVSLRDLLLEQYQITFNTASLRVTLWTDTDGFIILEFSGSTCFEVPVGTWEEVGPNGEVKVDFLDDLAARIILMVVEPSRAMKPNWGIPTHVT